MVPLRTSALLVALGILLAAPDASADPPQAKVAAPRSAAADDAKQAMALNDEAWALYEQGRYRAAVDKLELAVKMDPNGKDLVYNLALIHEKLANLEDAERHYRRYLEMETDPKARGRVQAVVRRLEGARRERDEQGAAQPAGPGPRSTAAPPPPDAPRPLRPWVIAGGATAATAFLLGSIFALSAAARNPGSDARTGEGVSIQDLQDDARAAHRHAIVADVSFLISAGALGVTTFLYFTTPRGAPAAPAHPARVSAAPGLLRVSF